MIAVRLAAQKTPKPRPAILSKYTSLTATAFDYLVVGAGSAGCAVAAGLAKSGAESVGVLEAGSTDSSWLVKTPFALMFMMGNRRYDWLRTTCPQSALGGRVLPVPRGKVVGGSGSINSMVWFRGRRADYDEWGLPDWRADEVARAFDEVEAKMPPQRLPDPHALSTRFARALGGNGEGAPTPEQEGAGVFRVNMRGHHRWSAADAFLRPAQAGGNLTVVTRAQVDRLLVARGRAVGIVLIGGQTFKARKGVVLSAGAIESPAVLMRSGIGPGEQLRSLGISVLKDAPQVGRNLHDHPSVGIHHAGANSGYGLTLKQLPGWAAAPWLYVLGKRGVLSSNIVEAGAFFHSGGSSAIPDAQVHFIPYMMGWRGKARVWGSGYFADVGVCRPKSRGDLKLVSSDPGSAPAIDLGLLNDPDDMTTLVAAFKRLRALLANAPFDDRRAPEVFPGQAAVSDKQIESYIRDRLGTAYHPVGTLRMGLDDAPVTPRLKVKGLAGLWVADASVMPQITSANTNAPSIMIGHRAAGFILEDTAADSPV